jgi:hypothetical protein
MYTEASRTSPTLPHQRNPREHVALRKQFAAVHKRLVDMMPKSAGTSSEVAAEAYRLISIDHTSAPDDSGADDWLVYRIAQGSREITGYRRGPIAVVTAEVRTIVDGLNARCLMSEKPGTPFRPLSAPRPAPTAVSLAHKDLR